MRDCSWLLQSLDKFENIRPGNFQCTSNRTSHLPCWGYNCIAWAAGKTDKWWWPIEGEPCAFWPIPVNSKDPVTLGEFIKAFESEGFSVCRNSRFENGFEKVAIYVDSDGEPTHAARLLPSGVWTSKMGQGEDIEHETLHVVEGEAYGTAKAFLKRPNPLCRKPNTLKRLLSRQLESLKALLKLFSSIKQESDPQLAKLQARNAKR
jgi:hypothetical protein